MKLVNNQMLQKTLMTAIAVSSLSIVSSVIGADFANVSYQSYQVAWDLSLPKGATGVTAKVVYTPNDSQADSYAEEIVSGQGTIVYPFNGVLNDGTYSWELRLMYGNNKASSIGSNGDGSASVVGIDANGRNIELAGKSLSLPKGKSRLMNKRVDGVQSGGFRVVGGVIPDFSMEEQAAKD